jgi:hypothetical protein
MTKKLLQEPLKEGEVILKVKNKKLKTVRGMEGPL